MNLIVLLVAPVLTPQLYKMYAIHANQESIRPIRRIRCVPFVRQEHTPLHHPLRRVNLAQPVST